MTDILTCVREFFREKGASYYRKLQHTGYLRHLMLRRGVTSGEILVHLVTTTQEEYDLEPLKDQLLALPLEGRIVGIMHILNDSLSDVVQSDETRILDGQDYFYETLLGLKFRISTFSFFQPNSLAAEVLYNIVRDYIQNTSGMEVFDLYSGTGTIAQLLAPVAKEVIGVEIVEDAVAAARENAKRAGVDGLSHFQQRPVHHLSHPKKYGFVITNPPYGERLEEKEDLPALYRDMGKAFAGLDGWSEYVITAYEDAERYFGRKADRNRKIYNGMLKTYFYQFLGPKPPKAKRPGEKQEKR